MSLGPYNAVGVKVEQAFAALLESRLDFEQAYLAEVSIQTGIDDETIQWPVIICFTESEWESVYGTQWKRVSCGVQVQSFKCDGADAHRNRIASIEDALLNHDIREGDYSNLALALTATSTTLHVHGVVPGRSSQTIVEDKWVWNQTFELLAEWVSFEDSSSSSSGSSSSESSLSSHSTSSSQSGSSSFDVP